MMYQQVIARRYAKGLMLAARGQDLDALEEEIQGLVAVFQQEKSDLHHLFTDPSFFPSEKKAVINRIAEKYHLNPFVRSFLILLVDKGRLQLLPLIYQALVALVDDYHGRVRAHIRSAQSLSEDTVVEIKSALKKMCKKDILADVAVDESLIGGVRVEMGSIVIDGSLRAKLDAIKNKLIFGAEAISLANL